MTGPLAILASVMVISGFHYLANTEAVLVHEILRRLYYVPIVIGATRYGIQGGLATSLLSSALYLPHIVLSWSGWPVFDVERYGEIVLFNVVGAVTGIMADRLRSEKNRYRRASEELEIAYDQLKTSMDARVQAERMAVVGRVAAGMAHDIRTPLSAILGCFEILGSDYPPDHPKHEFLEILRKEITRADGVVAAFLDFAQPAPPSFQPVDLNDLARSVARLAERSAGPVAVDPCPHSVPITVDAHHIQRALIELLLAGSALSSEGSVKLCTATLNSTATIRLIVEPVDQGLSGDLFEPFGGSHVAHGPMLPLARCLIENQGGRVTVIRHDRRLQFLVELPRTKAAIAAAALPLADTGS